MPCLDEHTMPRLGTVIAENLRNEYEPSTFVPLLRSVNGEVEWDLQIDKKALRWDSYVKAGYYGVLNRYFPPGVQSATDPLTPQSFPVPVNIMVTGTIPPGSGLSSSAAMVVSSTLAFLAVNGILEDPLRAPSKGELVEMAVENERRVGVNSGGMDQAASVISQAGSALYVSFFPRLSAQSIPIPSTSSPSSVREVQTTVSAEPSVNTHVYRATFVIAHTLVSSPKAVYAKTHYNLRVFESAVAARVLVHRLGLSRGSYLRDKKSMGMGGNEERVSLRDVLEALVDRESGRSSEGLEEDVERLRKGLERMIQEVECLRPLRGADQPGKECENQEAQEQEFGVDLDTMVEWTGMGREKFEEVYLNWLEVEADLFQLYKRAKHCYEEALRVLQFRDICVSTSPFNSPSPFLALAALMNASQESCSALYECTCPEIDLLTKLAREAGALGSRVTGAGWGGCTVSLVDESEVDAFIDRLRKTYPPYRNIVASMGREEADEVLRAAVFATKPSSGVCVYKFIE
ncbi:GHMP kinase [Scleroderma yunnanense]